jgi:NADH:ubiquinone oxidoreductase subunit E
MTKISDNDVERIGELLRALPPVPEGWVRAAQELPQARKEMDEIVARAEADQEFRAAVIADLETALRESGYEVNERLLPELQKRLSSF